MLAYYLLIDEIDLSTPNLLGLILRLTLQKTFTSDSIPLLDTVVRNSCRLARSFLLLFLRLIPGSWRSHSQKDRCSIDHWGLWWTHDSRSMQHDCWEARWLSHWSRSLSTVCTHEQFDLYFFSLLKRHLQVINSHGFGLLWRLACLGRWWHDFLLHVFAL